MLRPALVPLLLIISLSSASILRKSLSRRQAEPENCQAIEGFDCKCSVYRVTCTTDRVLPAQVNVLQNAKQKYPSVELIISGEHEQNVYDYTFEPVQQLYKPDADNLEFRVKFEKFTALHISSPGTFNRVFPPTTAANARKHLALEIYNPLVQPNDNENLFANLNVDSLELYVLYPFRGTFQQLFNGANIKNLRLSGGDIRSDLSKPFTGNIGRLELAKQASQLTVQNFPIYPAHELIINAFYVTDFTSDHPPNYSNLHELRIHSLERIPANAFRQYPNLKVLSLSTEKDIDPNALDGLYQLEKLTIKDTKPSLELLNHLYGLKEFETNVEKLSEREQCELAEKLASGQLAVQPIPSGRECTCVTAYLETASGRYPCDASNCDQSSCAAIRNNYDATARTFKAPPTVKRPDGSDASRPQEAKVYTSPYQISKQDREKYQQGAAAQQPQQPSGREGEGQTGTENQHGNVDGHDQAHPYHPDPNTPQGETNQEEGEEGSETVTPETDENPSDGEGNADSTAPVDPNQVTESNAESDAIDSAPAEQKKGLGRWLYVIIVVAAIAGLLLLGLIILLVRRKKRGYAPAAKSEDVPARA